jgi:Lar family restriction alleviation protein
MTDLKPCPFCGGEAEFSLGKTGDGADWHYLECGECEAMGPRIKYADHNIAVKEALAEAWNNRAGEKL